MKRLVASFVSVVPATMAIVAHDASANPPKPSTPLDPELVAPTRAEAPALVRKHAGVCYAFYPSGGTLAVECPTELHGQPLGEAVVRTPAKRCQLVPFSPEGPGKSGWLDACPPALEQIAEPGMVPDWSLRLRDDARAASGAAGNLDAPPPARLDATPQQVGCAGCATSHDGGAAWPLAAAATALAVARKRRRWNGG